VKKELASCRRHAPDRWRPAITSVMASVTASVALVALATACGAPAKTMVATTVASTTTTVPTIQTYQIDSEYSGAAGPRVAVIGDSLTVTGRVQLADELSGYRVKVASVVGEGIGGGPWSDVYETDVLGDAVNEYLTSDEPPDALVIALGTNNAMKPNITMEMFEAAWPEMVAGYTGGCLVVVTATETEENPGYDREEAALINERLRSEADRVVDWAAIARPEHVDESDHIHLTPAGLALRADLIAQAIDSCELAAEDGTGPTG